MALSVSVLVTTCPLVEGAAGVSASPGPTHWKTGVPDTVLGRVIEQVRVRDVPTTGEGVERERDIISGSTGRRGMT